MPLHILIVDDEAHVRKTLSDALERLPWKTDCAISLAENEDLAIKECDRQAPDIMFLDMRLHRVDDKAYKRAKKVLEFVAASRLATKIAVMSSFADEKSVMDLLGDPQEQSQDGLSRFFVPKHLNIEKVTESALLAVKALRPDSLHNDRDRVLGEIPREALRLARTAFPILLRGGPGTGKTLLASFIRMNSARREEPFQEINCANILDDGIGARQVFGIEDNVATEVKGGPGLIESANGGTIFLDEIADLTPINQARFLKIIAEGKLHRIGGEHKSPIVVDVRFIAATNQDVDNLVHEGRFREDLRSRFFENVITLPSLRDRLDDMEQLVCYHLAESVASQVDAGYFRGITAEAIEALRSHDWGNNGVRKLVGVLMSAATASEGHPISADNIRQALAKSTQRSASTETWEGQFSDLSNAEAQMQLFRIRVEEIRRRHPGCTHAFVRNELGMPEATYYRWKKNAGI